MRAFRGASKFFVMHYSCAIIIFFKMGSCKSAVSFYSFGKLLFRLCYNSSVKVFIKFVFKKMELWFALPVSAQALPEAATRGVLRN